VRVAILLRGINVGSANRLSMAELRAALADAGVPGVMTLLQSGNLVADWPGDPQHLSVLTRTTIADRFGLEVRAVARTADELERAVQRNPFPEEASRAPKLLQVTFLEHPPEAQVVAAAEGLLRGDERLAVLDRDVYSWHPDGIARSKLALALVGPRMPTATSRNWTTVAKLLRMVSDAD